MVALQHKVAHLETTVPLSLLTEQLMDGSTTKRPIVTIEPKCLVFDVSEPDKGCTTSLLLTNNTTKMELFKVGTSLKKIAMLYSTYLLCS